MVAVYARQSIDKKDSISIETQIDYCRAAAGDAELRVYEDRGYSGSNTNRPAFRRLLCDIRRGEITKVVIYKLDRMSRSLLDFSKLVELFRQYGVEFESTQEKFDTSTPIGNAMLSITMVFAQLERETIQQRIRDNYYSRGKKGMYLGGKPPFGYRKRETVHNGAKTSMLVPAPQELALVCEVYSMYADGGRSLGEIARTLNARRLPEGKRFDAGSLSRMVRNPVYVRADASVWEYYRCRGCAITNPVDDFTGENGCFLYGRRPGGGHTAASPEEQTLSVALHEGCIEPERWLRAQARLGRAGRPTAAAAPGGRLGTGGASWLSGLTVCGGCSSRMSVKTAVNRDRNTGEIRARYAYLTCNGRKTGRCREPARRSGLSARAVEEAVAAQLRRLTESKAALRYLPREAPGPEADALRVALAKTDDEIRNLVAAVRQGEPLTARYLEAALTELDRKKREQEAALAALCRSGEGEGFTLAEVFARFSEYAVPLRRRLASQLIERVEVRRGEEGDCLEIWWRYDFR